MVLGTVSSRCFPVMPSSLLALATAIMIAAVHPRHLKLLGFLISVAEGTSPLYTALTQRK